MKKRKRWKYAYYIGDEFITMGTSNEICEETGMTIQSFNWYRTNIYKKRPMYDENKRRTIVRVDEDEDLQFD